MTFVLIIYDLKTRPINTAVTEYAGADSEVITHYPNVDIQSKIKNAMLAKGYTNSAHTTQSHFPHNCLAKDNTTQQQAITDLIEVVKKHDAALDSYIAVTVSESYQADASLL